MRVQYVRFGKPDRLPTFLHKMNESLLYNYSPAKRCSVAILIKLASILNYFVYSTNFMESKLHALVY